MCFAHLDDKEPSHGATLPPSVADVIEPELDAITDEILATIAREVPEYARPLEGSFGRGVRTGVTEALRQFVELIRSPSGARGPGREVYVALGRGELRQGRTLDSLQSAYRVGARVAWRRVADAARRADVDAGGAEPARRVDLRLHRGAVGRLGRGLRRGAQRRLEGERRRRQRELVLLLLRDPPAEDADVRAAAAAVGWRMPRAAAALACAEEELERLARRLPADALVGALDGEGCAIVPDPEGPGRAAEVGGALRWAARPRSGPAVARGASWPRSWALARAALRAAEAGAIAAPTAPLRADDVLVDLLLLRGPRASSTASPRAGCRASTSSPRRRAGAWQETALAYVREGGNAAAMARALDAPPADRPLPAGAAARAARRPARRSRRAPRARAGAAGSVALGGSRAAAGVGADVDHEGERRR